MCLSDVIAVNMLVILVIVFSFYDNIKTVFSGKRQIGLLDNKTVCVSGHLLTILSTHIWRQIVISKHFCVQRSPHILVIAAQRKHVQILRSGHLMRHEILILLRELEHSIDCFGVDYRLVIRLLIKHGYILRFYIRDRNRRCNSAFAEILRLPFYSLRHTGRRYSCAVLSRHDRDTARAERQCQH